MPVNAQLKYLRIAPRKARLVADLIRGKTAEEAQAILNFTVKRAAKPISKLLKSAVANAEHNFHLREQDLYISKITVDEGTKLKRWRPRARGQAYEIQKKTCHVNLVLDPISGPKTAVKAPPPPSAGEKEEAELTPKMTKAAKPKFKPAFAPQKPRVERGMKKIFRRKAV